MKDNSRENTPPPEPGRFRTRLDALLLEGLNSPTQEINDEWWNALDEKVRAASTRATGT
jgi:hypothetical protein